MKILHTMLRVGNLESSITFYTKALGMTLRNQKEYPGGRFTLAFLGFGEKGGHEIELTYNWDGDEGLPSDSRHFGHLAYEVDDIYAMCQHLMDNGVTINRPPRDGRMAFVRSPDNVSIELLQAGEAQEPQEPWASMENIGHW